MTAKLRLLFEEQQDSIKEKTGLEAGNGRRYALKRFCCYG